MRQVNLRTRKINDDNHALKLELSTAKVEMKELETRLRHEHAEAVRGAVRDLRGPRSYRRRTNFYRVFIIFQWK